MYILVFFFNDTATTEIYTYGHTLSLHDALPIYVPLHRRRLARRDRARAWPLGAGRRGGARLHGQHDARARPAADPHPLRDHRRRRRAQRGAGERVGLLLRAPPEIGRAHV